MTKIKWSKEPDEWYCSYGKCCNCNTEFMCSKAHYCPGCGEKIESDVKYEDTIQIPLEVIPKGKDDILDKIRNEFINKYPKNYAGEPELGGRTCVFSLNRVLQIIDKYKAESEDNGMTNIKHKCRTCIHCDIEYLICRPNSKDCKPQYVLEMEDLDTEDFCDFYEAKKENKE